MRARRLVDGSRLPRRCLHCSHTREPALMRRCMLRSPCGIPRQMCSTWDPYVPAFVSLDETLPRATRADTHRRPLLAVFRHAAKHLATALPTWSSWQYRIGRERIRLVHRASATIAQGTPCLAARYSSKLPTRAQAWPVRRRSRLTVASSPRKGYGSGRSAPSSLRMCSAGPLLRRALTFGIASSCSGTRCIPWSTQPKQSAGSEETNLLDRPEQR